MGCLGVHFALDDDDAVLLRDMPEALRPRHVSDVIEEAYFSKHRDRLAESDKAWDAIHRSLTDGRLGCSSATYPLNLVVIGGQQLYGGPEHILSLKTPEQVCDVAPLLSAMPEDDFRRCYFAIDPDEYSQPLDEVDFGYSWEWFENVRDFWMRAASERRWVLFSVSQ